MRDSNEGKIGAPPRREGDPLYADEMPDPTLLAQLSDQDVKRLDGQALAIEFEILKSRYDELYDILIERFPEIRKHLIINAIHRDPLSMGLEAQDTSRIYTGE